MKAMKRGLTHAEALEYLGVKRRTFDTTWRPHLVAMKVGTCTVFDRQDLDALFDKFKAAAAGDLDGDIDTPAPGQAHNGPRNGRPAIEKGTEIWAEKQRGSTPRRMAIGKSTSGGTVLDFDTVASSILQRPKAGSSAS